jgi:hypothetical protein
MPVVPRLPGGADTGARAAGILRAVNLAPVPASDKSNILVRTFGKS